MPLVDYALNNSKAFASSTLSTDVQRSSESYDSAPTKLGASSQPRGQKKFALRCASLSVNCRHTQLPMQHWMPDVQMLAWLMRPFLTPHRRRLNSGNFGEISITSPVSTKHLKNNCFLSKPDQLAFGFKSEK